LTEHSQQYLHILRYKRALAYWKAAHLGEQLCHRAAAGAAKDDHPLAPEEQSAVDKWLDEKYPVRTKKGEKILEYPLRDVMRAE
jgi:hypothetical protein